MALKTLPGVLLSFAFFICSCGERSPDPMEQGHSTTPREQVLLVTDAVKPNARELYDKFMAEVLLPTLSSTCRTKGSKAMPRLLSPSSPASDDTWQYLLIIPVGNNIGSYSVAEVLTKKYGEQKAIEYQSIYMSCLKHAPELHTFSMK